MSNLVFFRNNLIQFFWLVAKIATSVFLKLSNSFSFIFFYFVVRSRHICLFIFPSFFFKVMFYFLWKDSFFFLIKINPFTLHIGSKIIKINYELSNGEIKKVNEECDLGISFNDTFKADNHILSIVLRANQLIGLVGRVFTNGLGDLGSILGCVISKNLKMVLDTALLNTQQYKVHIEGKVEQLRERSSTLPYTLV